MINTVRRVLHVKYDYPLHLGVDRVAPIWSQRANEEVAFVLANLDDLIVLERKSMLNPVD
jgi:hypothetical protein